MIHNLYYLVLPEHMYELYVTSIYDIIYIIPYSYAYVMHTAAEGSIWALASASWSMSVARSFAFSTCAAP